MKIADDIFLKVQFIGDPAKACEAACLLAEKIEHEYSYHQSDDRLNTAIYTFKDGSKIAVNNRGTLATYSS